MMLRRIPYMFSESSPIANGATLSPSGTRSHGSSVVSKSALRLGQERRSLGFFEEALEVVIPSPVISSPSESIRRKTTSIPYRNPSWGRHAEPSTLTILASASIMVFTPVITLLIWVALEHFSGSLQATLTHLFLTLSFAREPLPYVLVD